jgi:hypothetical protein
MAQAKKKDDAVNVETQEAPAQEAVTAEIPEQVKPVGVNRFGLASEKRNHYYANVPHGTNPEICLEPEFWVHVARHLGRGDMVTIEPDDLAWEMSVKVLDRGHNWASVRKRMFVKYGTVEIAPEVPKQHKIEWAGQTDMFRVTYKGEVLRKGFATEILAQQWANNHAQALKR